MTERSPETRFCPHCRTPVDHSARFCGHCGNPLPAPTLVTHQPQPDPKRDSRPPPGNRLLPVAISFGLLVAAVVVCGLAGFLLWGDQIGEMLRPAEAGRLSFSPRAADGSVSGKYRLAKVTGGGAVRFTVTADGFATFQLEGSPASETLAVALRDEVTATMTWAGVTLDGMGELTPREQVAMDNLLTRSSHLSNGLSMIPLDMACQGDALIDDKQVAALLFPVQMRIKYLTAGRQALAVDLIARSVCNYASQEEGKAEQPSLIQLTPAMPVPVVLGYFPFDEVGAKQPPVSLAPWPDTACLSFAAVMAPAVPSPLIASDSGPEAAPATVRDVVGPCSALCRGACGPSCTPNNCTRTRESECEKDEQGQNTGTVIFIDKFNCGLHQGCIDHDACYDQCNGTFGCGTWEAAYCRHGRSATLATYLADTLIWGYSWCDEAAVGRWGFLDSAGWVRGYGPQPIRQDFEYTGGSLYAPERCPIVADRAAALTATPVAALTATRAPTPSTTRAVSPTTTRTPASTATRAAAVTATRAAVPTATRVAARTATPGFLVWVRQDPAVVNVNKDPLEGSAPEPRWAGSFSRITVSGSSFTTQERYVEYGSEWYSVSITCKFDTPPLVLNPSLRYSIKANCSHGGTPAKGGEGLGEQFWYTAQKGYQNIISPPDVLKYYPWSPSFDGTASKEWMVTAPPANRPGDTFQLYASMWNRPPCNVTWTYRAEYH
jgi:hypothetical protein